MLHVSTAILSTGSCWCAIHEFDTVHGFAVTSYAEIAPFLPPAHSRSFTPSKLKISDDDTLTTSTHTGASPPPPAIDHILICPPSCARYACPGSLGKTVAAVTAPRCSVGSNDRPTLPCAYTSYTRIYGPFDPAPGTLPPPPGSRVDVHSCTPSIFANSCFSAMRTTRGVCAASSRSASSGGIHTSVLPVSSSVTIDSPCRNMCVTVCAWTAGRNAVTLPVRTSSSIRCPSLVPIHRNAPRSSNEVVGRNSTFVILKSLVLMLKSFVFESRFHMGESDLERSYMRRWWCVTTATVCPDTATEPVYAGILILNSV